MLVKGGKLAANLVKLIKGEKHCSKFLQLLAFGSYNKRIPNAKHGEDWLTRDESIVKEYRKDPWCGFVPTTSFFCDMMGGLESIHKSSAMQEIPVGLPILFIYGLADPVGDYGKTVNQLAAIYRVNGIKDITEKAYEGMRHELFNEIDKELVFDDVLAWLYSKL